MIQNDTICAIATGATNSGISIIRISGPEAFSVADRIFAAKKPGKKISDRKTHTLTYGHIVSHGEIVDEVLVSVFRAPNSYTAENVCEINCHGGMVVTRKIFKCCIEAGARPAEPGEFTKRAFLNGRIDLSQAEAVIDIINASNESAARNSVFQLSGKLKDEIVSLRNIILTDTAFIEAALDDPEHISLDGFSETLSAHTSDCIERIGKLLRSYDCGRIVKNGIRTVILGKPNVGKSTLLNALSGSERAIVTDVPGTTRDVLEEQITIDGIPFVVVDTAGIRDTDDIVEKIGVDKAYSETESADLVLFVADASVMPDDNDLKIIEFIKDKKAVVLLNKSDLSPVLSADRLSGMTGKPVISISAKNEEGFELFFHAVRELFDLGRIGRNEDVFITRERHRDLLLGSERSLLEVMNSLRNDMPEDFYSIDLMDAYRQLGEIVGEEISDDLADKIFSDFCMGK